MKNILLLSFLITILLVFTPILAEKRDITCYAKAGLGIYDVHGVHEGYGETIYKAAASAMADCRSKHPFIGCVPLIGCK